MNVTIFYHGPKGFGRMSCVCELRDAQEWFERTVRADHYFAGAVLTDALL